MLFNSLAFAVFLPLVWALYWALFNRHVKWRNAFIMTASFVFYGWWDWRYLVLMVGTSLIDFTMALAMQRSNDDRRRKLLLGVSLVSNLGILGTFKYFDFFSTSLEAAFGRIGIELDAITLDLVLPVGISFYTFQALSYTIDVYRKQLDATSDVTAFLAYISFFPQLVAGPIERAAHLLPQFSHHSTFDHVRAVRGLELILWGFFKKVVIADNCAPFVNAIFDDAGSADLHAGYHVLGAVLFAFQVYGDFSGYSDIATGCARLFGFELMRNFAYPFFSRDMAEFWQRWHISLNSWFRDYVYVPLGGSRLGQRRTVFNTAAVFVLSGFWHGADFNFVAWGAFNALLFIPLLLLKRTRRFSGSVAQGKLLPSALDSWRMLVTFALFCAGLVIFRSTSLTSAAGHFQAMFTQWTVGGGFDIMTLDRPNALTLVTTLALIGLFIVMEWAGRDRWETLGLRWPFRLHRWFQLLVALTIMLYGEFNQNEFIYFQF
jgi:alginate O-acetyltransferase complex protein AlgI